MALLTIRVHNRPAILSLNQQTEATTRLSAATTQLGTRLDNAGRVTTRYANAGKRVAATNEIATRSMLKLTAASRSMTLTLGSRGGGGVIGGFGRFFAAFAAFRAVSEGARAIGNYEESMAKLRGVVIRTSDPLAAQERDMRLLAETTRELGETTSFTTTEVAQGLFRLGQGGQTATESITSIGTALNLAMVESISMAEASRILVQVLAQFNLQATEASRVGDVLALVTARTAGDITEMYQALKLAGPVANAAGLSFEKTAVTLGILADAGLQGTRGGTNLRNILIGLLDPTNKAQLALARLTTEERGNVGAMRDLLPVLEDFRAGQITAAEAAQIFTRRAQAGALVLTSNTEKYKELEQAARNAGGELERRAGLISDTLPRAWARLGAALQEVTLGLGDAGVAGAMRATVDFLTEGVRSVDEFTDSLTSAQIAARSVVVGIGAAGLAGALKVLLSFVSPIGLAVAALSALAIQIHSVRNSSTEATLQLDKFQLKLRDLKNSSNIAERALGQVSSQFYDLLYGSPEEREGNRREAAIARMVRQVNLLRKETEKLTTAQDKAAESGNLEEQRASLEDLIRKQERLAGQLRDDVRRGITGPDDLIPFKTIQGILPPGIEQALLGKATAEDDQYRRSKGLVPPDDPLEVGVFASDLAEALLEAVRAAREVLAPLKSRAFLEELVTRDVDFSASALDSVRQSSRAGGGRWSFPVERFSSPIGPETAARSLPNAANQRLNPQLVDSSKIGPRPFDPEAAGKAATALQRFNEKIEDNLRFAQTAARETTAAAKAQAAAEQFLTLTRALSTQATKEEVAAQAEAIKQKVLETERLSRGGKGAGPSSREKILDQFDDDRKQISEDVDRRFGQDIAASLVDPLRQAILDGDFEGVGRSIAERLATTFLENMLLAPVEAYAAAFARDIVESTGAGSFLKGAIEEEEDIAGKRDDALAKLLEQDEKTVQQMDVTAANVNVNGAGGAAAGAGGGGGGGGGGGLLGGLLGGLGGLFGGGGGGGGGGFYTPGNTGGIEGLTVPAPPSGIAGAKVRSGGSQSTVIDNRRTVIQVRDGGQARRTAAQQDEVRRRSLEGAGRR